MARIPATRLFHPAKVTLKQLDRTSNLRKVHFETPLLSRQFASIREIRGSHISVVESTGSVCSTLHTGTKLNPRKGLKMKVLLLKDVYKLGHAGDIKKVADGYGRNYLLPMGMAVLATAGSLKQVEHIRTKAAEARAALTNEMSGVAEKMKDVHLVFTSKAGETGKLYGSITSQMVCEAINKQLHTKLDRHQVECEPIRTLGEHKARVRLTVDLVPEIGIRVYREGEAPVAPARAKVEAVEEAPAAEAPAAEEAA